MAQISIAVKVLVTIQRDDEAGVFVSRCPVLNIFSQGESEDEAKAAIEEAVRLQLMTAYRFDRLHQLLLRSGFINMTGGPDVDDLESLPGQYVAVNVADKTKQFKIEVPLTLVAAAAANNSGWQLSH